MRMLLSHLSKICSPPPRSYHRWIISHSIICYISIIMSIMSIRKYQPYYHPVVRLHMSLIVQLYVYILYPMSAVAFCASIYMTLAVTVKDTEYSSSISTRYSKKFKSTLMQSFKNESKSHIFLKRLNDTSLCADHINTERSA